MSSRFFENPQLNEICSHLIEKASKGRFFKSNHHHLLGWRQQIIVLANMNLAVLSVLTWKYLEFPSWRIEEQYVLDSLNFIGVCKAKARRHFFLLISPINLKTEIIKLELNNDMLKVNEQRRQPAKFT